MNVIATVPRATAALLAGLALAACSPSFELPAGATIACRTTADCPGGLVCQLDRCRDPAQLDTTPPDLAGSVTVAPPRGKAGTAFTVHVPATEPLAAAPRVTLGVSPPVDLACAAATGNAWDCTYTAAGGENGGAGGTAFVTVRLLDAAGNETIRGNVASLELDFASPAVLAASTSYAPPPTGLLPFVQRAAAGTVVRVAVSAREQLAAEGQPALSAPAAPALAFALEASASDGAVFVATVPAGLADGSYPLRVTWTDEVGNAGTADLPASANALVKTSAPVLTVDQAKLVFVRAPQGNAAPEALGGYTIPAGPYFAVEPDDPLSAATTLPAGALTLGGGATPTRVVVQSSGGASPLVLGVLAPDASGLFPRQQLVSPDLAAAWLVGVDDAGNRSAPVRLQRAEWVATSNRPLAGARPQDVEAMPAAWPARALPGTALPVTGTADAGADQAAVVTRSALSWTEREPTTAALRPANRADHGMAWDAARGRIVLYGGYASGQDRYLSDTWEWDGAAWEDVTPKGGLGPGDQQSPQLAYDASRARTVLFSDAGRTWEWDGAAWLDVTPAGPGPSARASAALAYDAVKGRVVLFGGAAAGGPLPVDTWEWDGTAWKDVTPAGASPPGRSLAVMAHDGARGRVVLFGGYGAGSLLQDTWEWDGAAWKDVTPAGTKPSGRERPAFAWDAARGRTVLFAGQGAAGTQDTWEWDGATWKDVTPAAKPVARGRTAMAYDAARRVVVAFGGGATSSSDRGDTLTFEGTAWTDLTPSGTWARWRDSGGMVWQAARRSALVFGGYVFNPGAISESRLQDTWEWDGTVWRERTLATGNPPTRKNLSLAHDPVRGRTVLFGGVSTVDTWEWDGTTWLDVTPAGTKPAARTGANMVYDAARARTVLFGGQAYVGGDQQDTWGWDGATWTLLASTGPSARSFHAMAYDEKRQRVVLFGGGANLADTWEWNGTAWANVTPAAGSPPGRANAAMAYDAARGKVVLSGGSGPGGAYVDVWEWSGTAWTDVTPPGLGPSARAGMRAVFDPVRAKVVAFGGGGISSVPASVWELDVATGRTPAVQLDASLAAAGFGRAQLTALRARAWAGGTSGAGLPGAQLLGWAGAAPGGQAGWVALAANGVGVGASAPVLPAPPASLVAWSSASASDAARFVTERDGRISLQVRPLGPAASTAAGAAAALDFVELRVRYQTAP